MSFIPTKSYSFNVRSGPIVLDHAKLADENADRKIEKVFDLYTEEIDRAISLTRAQLPAFTNLQILDWNVSIVMKGWGWLAKYSIIVLPNM